MPLSKYDHIFGGKEGAAEKALAAMKKQYGRRRGTSVFYAKINKEKEN